MSLINKNARSINYVDSVSFISDSMIGNACINVANPMIDLEAFADKSNFKLYLCDTGLLITAMIQYDEKPRNDIYRSILKDDFGMVMENAVAQMLCSSGHNLYFHEFLYQANSSETEKKYEIDFLAIRNRKICPIEVKSSSYRRHASFDNFRKKYQIRMKDRFVIYARDLSSDGDVYYIPAYMTELI